MTKIPPSFYRRMGREGFVPGEPCRFGDDPDYVEGWEQSRLRYEARVKRQAKIEAVRQEVCKLHDAKDVDDLKVWLEKYVLDMVLRAQRPLKGRVSNDL